MLKIFSENINRTDDNLFYKRYDKNDVRLGDIVKTAFSDYEKAKIVILGSPQDEGVKRNKGREGARQGPSAIRKAFYKLSAGKFNSSSLFDLGDIKTDKPLEDVHNIQMEVVQQVLKDEKRIIILGGGNDISYPDCKALSLFNKNILAINIDSHFDVRADDPQNSGTPYRMLLEENYIKGDNFFEVGIKRFGASPVYENYLRQKSAHIFYNDEVNQSGIRNIFENILKKKSEVIFWGFDMDSVSEVYAPGVSAPGPAGLTANDAIEIAAIAGRDKRTKIFEISEVNPKFDIDGRTSRLAAVMIWNFLSEISF